MSRSIWLPSRRRLFELGGGLALASGADRAFAAGYDDGLPRGRPEVEGVDPAAITAFLDEVGAAGLELHSFMLTRGGKVISEGWWSPYAPARRHMMHSLTKSVMACGVAYAIEDKRFGLDDKVVSFFPEHLPPVVDDKLAAMTVRDLLTMRTGHASETSGSAWRPIRTSWVAEFFKIPVVHQPGTQFVYTSAASYMLSAIITKTTGERLADYLRPRLFEPLGISDLHWDVGPENINAGGNGLSWRTADIAKLSMLHAQGGRWKGRQVLPAAWVAEATRNEGGNDHYGYQWWIGPGDAYYANGLFCQFGLVFPHHDATLSITGAIHGSRHLLPIVWRHFPAAFGSSPAPSRDAEWAKLRLRTAELALLPKPQPSTSPLQKEIGGRTFVVEPNEDGVVSLKLDFSSGACAFTQVDGRGRHVIRAGMGSWIEGETSMTGAKLHHEYELDSMPVVAGAVWTDPRTLEMTWQFVESAFRDRVVCRFEDGAMTLDRSVNVNSAALSRPTLRGRLA